MLFINVEFKMVGVFAHSNAFLVGKPVKVPLIKQSSFQLECNETQFNYSAMVVSLQEFPGYRLLYSFFLSMPNLKQCTTPWSTFGLMQLT